MLYDPAKSETFRALQEEGLGDVVKEVPVPVETKVFTAPPVKVKARQTQTVFFKATYALYGLPLEKYAALKQRS